MIGRIRGTLLNKQAPELLVDVQGVAYEIYAPMTTIYQLPDIGQPVTLHIHFVVREDAQLLYGFADAQDRQLFRMLIKVNGVGPRLALTILSGMESHDFVRCVHNNDTAALMCLPGVGKKTAERLLIDMRDRLQDWAINTDSMSVQTAQGVGGAGEVNCRAEAESALMALGYKPQEASRAVAVAVKSGAGSSEELIRLALKSMVRA